MVSYFLFCKNTSPKYQVTSEIVGKVKKASFDFLSKGQNYLETVGSSISSCCPIAGKAFSESARLHTRVIILVPYIQAVRETFG